MKAGRSGSSARLRAALAAAAVLLSLAGGEADAYVRTLTAKGHPLFWNSATVPVIAYVGEPVPPLDGEAFPRALSLAAAAWSDEPCTSLELRIIPAGEASGPAIIDGVNRITFRRRRWCREPSDPPSCHGTDVLAVTHVTRDVNTGAIIDADIEINAVSVAWAELTVDAPRPGAPVDLQSMLTHELGHLIGLDHTCTLDGTGTPVDSLGNPVKPCDAEAFARATTMYPSVMKGSIRLRDLADDERRAVCDIYPIPPRQLEGTGCSVAGRGWASPAAVLMPLVIAMIRGTRRARGRRPFR